MKVHIRWMIRRDMAEVLDIERSSYPPDIAWTEEGFIHHLRERNCIGMVAEGPNERVVGFFIYDIHKTRLHVLNIAVHPEFRRIGIGRHIVEKLLGKLSAYMGRVRICLEVRESNLDAQLFFKAMGFKGVTVLRGFYEDSDEDAYLMQYRLPVEVHA